MPGKTQGSAGPYVTLSEAAKLLGVGTQQVHHLDRGRVLEAHYPLGKRGGKHFLEEDVLTLMELRKETEGGLAQKLPRLAMRAVLASRRAERKVDALLHYLGLDSTPMPSDGEGALALHRRADAWLRIGAAGAPEERLELARLLLGVTEEYLEIVCQAARDPDAWKLYFELGAELAKRVPAGDPLAAYVEHARRSARAAAYFYLRGAKGARHADRQIPGERYSDLLLRAWPSS